MKDGGHVVVGICREYTIAHASRVQYFARDATFKTVMPETRRIGDTELFLYNICCPSREGGGANSAGTVCFRAVMNGLSADVYQVIWEMFFREVLKAKAHDLQFEEESFVMAVPYIPIPPTLEKNAWHFDSVASDFDAAETLGMALAVKDFVGGSVEDHFRNLFIGCGVHLHRMF